MISINTNAVAFLALQNFETARSALEATVIDISSGGNSGDSAFALAVPMADLGLNERQLELDSTKLAAERVKEQLALQSLNIVNRRPRILLSLFGD